MIEPPIIISEHGDLMLFVSVADAENYLEAIDVVNNEYSAFDSEGKKLSLRVAADLRPALFSLGTVKVDVVKIEENGSSNDRSRTELRSIINQYFAKKGTEVSNLTGLSLVGLTEILKAEIGFAGTTPTA